MIPAAAEPFMPAEGMEALENLAFDLAREASELSGQLHPIIRLSVGDLVTMRNTRGKTKLVRKRRVIGPRLVSRKGNPPDSEIDTTDIPPLSEDFFRKAVRNPFYRRAK